RRDALHDRPRKSKQTASGKQMGPRVPHAPALVRGGREISVDEQPEESIRPVGVDSDTLLREERLPGSLPPRDRAAAAQILEHFRAADRDVSGTGECQVDVIALGPPASWSSALSAGDTALSSMETKTSERHRTGHGIRRNARDSRDRSDRYVAMSRPRRVRRLISEEKHGRQLRNVRIASPRAARPRLPDAGRDGSRRRRSAGRLGPLAGPGARR